MARIDSACRDRRLYFVGLLSLTFITLAACGGHEVPPTPPGRSAEPSSPLPSGPPPEPPAGLRLPEGVRPTAYRLALKVDPDADGFSGQVAITVISDAPRRVIFLHAKDLRIANAEVGLPDGTSLPARLLEVRDDGLAALETLREMPAGELELRVAYEAAWGASLEGLYRVRDGGASYAFTQFEATAARKAFPCFDEPRWKTPFSLEVSAPEGAVVAANTPEAEREALEDGWARVRFAETPPMPTYLLALAVGPLDVVEAPPLPPSSVRDRPLPLRGIAVRGRGRQLAPALERVGPILAALEAYFGAPYPYAKLDLVAVPDFGAGAMENPGLVTFREALLLLGRDAPDFQQRAVASVIAHELAHMWFGDLVTMTFWDDLWLNESFATWMSARALAVAYPEYHPELAEVASIERAMGADSLMSARSVRQPIESEHDIENAFDAITYRKGAGVLRMFERYVGASVFQAGVRAYLERHRWGTATAADLVGALSEASGKDLHPAFESFLEQPGVPLLEVAIACGAEGATATIHQTRYRPLGRAEPSEPAEPSAWVVPACLRYGQGGAAYETCALLDAAEVALPLPDVTCPSWVMPNADAAGYYRFALDVRSLEGLRRWGTRFLSPAERLAVIDSVVAGHRQARVPFRTMFRFLTSVAESSERYLAVAPMEPLTFAVERVVAEAARPRARSSLRKLYQDRVRTLGWGPRRGRTEDGERRLLRADVLGFLALVGRDTTVRGHALIEARALLGTQQGGRLDRSAVEPGLVGMVLVVGVEDGGAPLYDAAEHALFGTGDALLRTQLLRALGSARDPELAERARALALDPRVRLNELAITLHAQMDQPETRDAAFAFVEAHWDDLVARLGRVGAGRLVGLGAEFCTEEDAERVEAFFRPRIEALGGGPRELGATLERIRLCAAEVRAHREDTTAFFMGGG
jgi:alanyl aminopeptidase